MTDKNSESSECAFTEKSRNNETSQVSELKITPIHMVGIPQEYLFSSTLVAQERQKDARQKLN